MAANGEDDRSWRNGEEESLYYADPVSQTLEEDSGDQVVPQMLLTLTPEEQTDLEEDSENNIAEQLGDHVVPEVSIDLDLVFLEENNADISEAQQTQQVAANPNSNQDDKKS